MSKTNSHAFSESKTATALLNSRPSCPFMPVFGAPQVMFERGQGTQLWDVNGKRYLDFLCGIAVTSLGHSNPVVAAAISHQANTLLHVSNFFANPVATQTALMVDKLLSAACGEEAGYGQVFFCNSGAEANEAGIKLARKFGGRGKHVVVSALGSFHGRTLAALAATGQPEKHEPFAPMPEGFRHVVFNDIASLESALDETVAAVLLETIQGEGGVVPASVEYLQAARKMCTDRGILLMIDEVQTGFARTGKWFGFEHAEIKPDVVMLAKAMGNGMPIGALWASQEIASVFKPGDHGSTYSGTALATAAARATMQLMIDMNAPEVVIEKGTELTAKLRTIDGVVDVRGRGLLLAAELSPELDAKKVALQLLDKGLVVNGVTSHALRLAPPFTVSSEEIDEAIAIMKTVL
ncbi:MAG: acetylornithine/succinylornithine family transaminase [Ilumatobacteraceae bacterium]|nr:MAG: acetylornithine aminotransferase [Acidimicrobium sp. BACL27 MAG-120823-bin4]MDA2964438.1 acetylornithine/succinylornithine family transaminase [Actinomycetota bacterium]MDP4694742.1 acetylornithine/succinylornithine family transaminase [Ilumatobacteraceae bacterium]